MARFTVPKQQIEFIVNRHHVGDSDDAIRADIRERAQKLKNKHNLVPGLAVIIVGNDPASAVYVRNKVRACGEVGINSEVTRFDEATSEAQLIEHIQKLNANPAVHGILVQLPLPQTISVRRILEAIAVEKDVDGFHPVNVGLLGIGDTDRALVPCTPAGSMILLERAARALRLSQPTAFRHVQQLEETLATELVFGAGKAVV